ncbi:4Fe-4S ferredoxin iron-sulfur binding domain protein [Gottschalkia purinilytica]|uniref:4Fe-4S ferredoxin iron-sulfur binding domain protein n=1 Tax=Gottschalkia purinilytica TaxID=1503 RepID=A0A0L0W906_GOTPU|nr:4Fe-4S binding protein [Gottschalkia purinilytica]KNF07790.1 4Fe-4S ferredoxin iron-sulfur binding domain protein [Gottschalkia purinilytica]
MAIRKILEIDEEKCDGCGLCIPKCEEGAIRIVNGKAKLIADNLCDGLGNCLGHCPKDAIKLIERDADEFDEKAVEDHLNNMKASKSNHNIGGGCPGTRTMVLNRQSNSDESHQSISSGDIEIKIKPQLTQWPVQLKLVSELAPFLDGRELLIAADCVPFAYPNFHLDLLKNKSVVVGCPKLDDIKFYIEKLTNMIKLNDIKGITVAHMEVPCCTGIVMAAEEAVRLSGKNLEVKKVRITINGEKQEH